MSTTGLRVDVCTCAVDNVIPVSIGEVLQRGDEESRPAYEYLLRLSTHPNSLLRIYVFIAKVLGGEFRMLFSGQFSTFPVLKCKANLSSLVIAKKK